MPKMRLGYYAGASTALAGAVVCSAFQQRANFYSAMVYLSQSNFCLLVLINFTLLIYGTFVYGLSQLCWGTLRAAEVEQLTERAWFAITETCLAMTIFRDELGAWFLVMFTALVTGKVWGWIGDGRVEFLEQQPPANPRLFHTRLTVSLLMSFVYDVWILRYCINTVIQEARADMMVMFLFEFAVLTTTSWRSGARYILSIIEQKMIQTQTQARLLERRQEVREQREAMIRQRAEATASGQPTENEEPLPNPDGIDEMDIEVPGWATKGEWVLWLDLLTDTVKLILYVTFFVLLTIFYTFPIHIMRDLLMTARDFLKRLNSVLRYRRAIQEMNRYPDAAQAELDQENTCIICREEMRVWDLNANPGALDRIRPKKLPCGHILHLGCLKSWLERQQVCPTCRSPVTADRTNPMPNQNANRVPAAPQIQNNGLQAARLGLAQEPRLGRFGQEQPLLDHAAHGALGVDAFGRPINAMPQAAMQQNPANVRPIEEFHDMIRDEEQRRMEAEERVRRRWRIPPQSQQEQPQQLPEQGETSQNTSQMAPQIQSVNIQGQLADAPQQAIRRAESQPTRAELFRPQYAVSRTHRVRTLANLFSQASMLVRQEAEALRISTEQLHVLGQLMNEFERLELSSHENAEVPRTTTPGETQNPEQVIAQPPSVSGYQSSRAVPSRTHSPIMMRHGATSFSASIPAGSPDLPEGVAIPPGWSLMPLQRLDHQLQAYNAGTQRSSRTPSAGPASSPLAEDRNPRPVPSQAPTSQPPTVEAPTLQPTSGTTLQVLDRIPGTNNFRVTQSIGSGTRPEASTSNPDSFANAQPGTIITQQQLLDHILPTTRGRDLASRTRTNASTGNSTVTSNHSAPIEQQAAAVAAPSPLVPNWGGSSQLFGNGTRSEPTENSTPATGHETSVPTPTVTQPADQNGEGSRAASAAASRTQAEDTQSAQSSKVPGRAVTMEEISDEDYD